MNRYVFHVASVIVMFGVNASPSVAAPLSDGRSKAGSAGSVEALEVIDRSGSGVEPYQDVWQKLVICDRRENADSPDPMEEVEADIAYFKEDDAGSRFYSPIVPMSVFGLPVRYLGEGHGDLFGYSLILEGWLTQLKARVEAAVGKKMKCVDGGCQVERDDGVVLIASYPDEDKKLLIMCVADGWDGT